MGKTTAESKESLFVPARYGKIQLLMHRFTEKIQVPPHSFRNRIFLYYGVDTLKEG